jgi:hypothetical protein
MKRTGKKEFSINIICRENFEEFKKEYPEHKNMEYKEFIERWKEFTETLHVEVVTNPLGVKLGSYLGELKYQYLPYKFKPTGYNTFAQTGQESPFTNLNTKGKVGIVKWERRWAVKFNKILQFYGFDPFRRMNMLAKAHTDENPHTIRMSRITTGGKSVWRQKI